MIVSYPYRTANWEWTTRNVIENVVGYRYTEQTTSKGDKTRIRHLTFELEGTEAREAASRLRKRFDTTDPMKQIEVTL